MTTKLKIRKHGRSLGLTIPKDIVGALGLEEGDELYVLQTPNGMELTPYDPDFAATLEDARSYMKRHRNALKALAEGQ